MSEKCPDCGGIIEYDDTINYDRYDETLSDLCVGHCVECGIEYQWREVYEIKYLGVEDFDKC